VDNNNNINNRLIHADIDSRYVFEPIAVEILGVFNFSACLLLNELGKRISAISGEAREASFLFQQASVSVQRFNAVLYVRDSLPAADCTD